MKIYRRIVILIALLITTYLIDYSVKNWFDPGNKDLVEAFNYSDFEINEATLKCWGRYKSKYLTEEEIRTIVEEIGNKLNLCDYQANWTEEENQKAFTIFKEANHAQTTIQMIEGYQETDQNTFRVNNYLIVEIKLKNLYTSIAYYEKLITDCYEELGVNPNTNISAVGSKNGMVSEQEAYQLMETMLESLGGSMRNKEQVSDAYTLMGYCEKFPRYLKINGEKVNIDMAVTFQEEDQKTFLNMAMPVITSDY